MTGDAYRHILSPVSIRHAEEPKIRISFFIEPALKRGLSELQERYGVPEAESIRRAIAQYLEAQGVTERTKGGASRKRR